MTVQFPGQPQQPKGPPAAAVAPAPPQRPLRIGDIWPNFPLHQRSGATFTPLSDDQAGKLHVLVFLGGPGKPKTDALLAALEARRDDLAEAGAELRLVLTEAEAASPRPAGQSWPYPLLVDKTGQGFAAAGMAVTFGKVLVDQATILAVGPNLHVLSVVTSETPDPVTALLSRVTPMARRRGGGVMTVSHPPVLMVPDVFGPEECRQLIEIYKTTGTEFVEPGHNRLQDRTTDAKMRIPEYGRDDRIDHWVCARETNQYIDQRLVPRLMPEIAKAFNYKVTRHERYRIACYEGARGGSQHGHRDNVEPIVAHRRFAVTINLNSDEYEGAELKFPEFGDMVYKPASGTAIVFSCSLLHEVMAMRSGARFALLAFLFGES